MKRIKKYIIISCILILLLIILVLTIIILNKKSNIVGTDFGESDFERKNYKQEIQDSIVEVTNRNEYYAVTNIIGKYAYAINEKENEAVISRLDEKYVNENNINSENINQFVENLIIENLSEKALNNLKINTIVDKMFYIQSEVRIKTFFVYGKFTNNMNKDKIEFNIMVQADSRNNTFLIYPTSYVKKNYPNEKSLEKYSIDIQQIDKNEYNTFSYVNIDDATIINDYIAKFRNSIINVDEESYNLLDEEYKNSKFDNIEEYKKYINKNIRQLLSINIVKYKKEVKDNQTNYICLDSNGNYYILKETAVMKFTIILDTYSILLPEFTEKYDNANNNEKVAMNIDNIVQALNRKDSKYIYNKLDETFKKNNFPTLNDFENYINKNYASTYDFEYSTYSEEKGTYVQTIELKEKNNKDATPIKINIIMQLKENYQYIMSFSVE